VNWWLNPEQWALNSGKAEIQAFYACVPPPLSLTSLRSSIQMLRNIKDVTIVLSSVLDYSERPLAYFRRFVGPHYKWGRHGRLARRSLLTVTLAQLFVEAWPLDRHATICTACNNGLDMTNSNLRTAFIIAFLTPYALRGYSLQLGMAFKVCLIA
jgi:hypothetical protein